MKVSELITILQGMDQDAVVMVHEDEGGSYVSPKEEDMIVDVDEGQICLNIIGDWRNKW
jgi:hypothetical protein